MTRPELALLALFGVCWLAAMGMPATGFPLAGALPLDLYLLYGLAAVGGWLCGNVLVSRWAARPPGKRRVLLLVYLVGPMGPLCLLYGLAPDDFRRLAPLAPLWAFAVFLVLFLVPVTFRGLGPSRRR